MNVLKKWWLWYWIIALILIFLIWPYLEDTMSLAVSLVFLVGFFSIISLIMNISQHIKNKTSLVKDWKFWIWLILFLPFLWLLIVAAFIP
jgi:hypothetical protein